MPTNGKHYRSRNSKRRYRKKDLCPPGLAGYLADLAERYLVKRVEKRGNCNGVKKLYPVLKQLCECIVDPEILNSGEGADGHGSIWIECYVSAPALFLELMRYLKDSYNSLNPLVWTLREKRVIKVFRTGNSGADPYDENDPRNVGRPFRELDVTKATAKEIGRYIEQRYGHQWGYSDAAIAKQRERFAKCNFDRQTIIRRTIHDAIAHHVKDPKLVAQCHRQLDETEPRSEGSERCRKWWCNSIDC